ncbi:MAG TPA: ABC transporter ATP-binding protein [Lacibacter sp.]|nr:ABC transporter ATP-binding protein [Lacibacter sp.]
MKKIFRLLSFAKPLRHYFPEYIIYTVLGILFGLLNFTMLIPILRILFGQEALQNVPVTEPAFRFSIGYFADLFTYWFAKIVATKGNLTALALVCGIIVVSTVLANISRYLAVRVLMRLRLKLLQNVRNTLYNKLMNQSLSYYHNARKGDIVTIITNEVQEIESSVVNSLQVWLKDPLIVIVYFGVLFYMSPSLTLFTLFFLPVSGLLISYITKRLKQIGWFSQELFGRIMSFIDESVTGVKVIQSFTAEEEMTHRFEKLNREFSKTSKKMFGKRELAAPISEVLGVMVVIGIVLYGGNLLLNGKSALDGSEFITYLILYSQIIQPLKSISNTTTNLQRGLIAADKIFATLDAPVAITDKPGAIEKKNFEQAIEVKNLSFDYTGKPVLKNVSFTIDKGKTVALVGESGSGKSTLADLLQRFYDPKEGGIFVDGTDIRDLKLKSLRGLIATVSQEAILFHDSVKNNIVFNGEENNPEKLQRAASIANAHSFIEQMDQQYETQVGDRGMKMSGGQRQRVTIARAVYKDAPILILDEATSALDTESERLVQDAINKMMQNRTSVVIAHRLSTVRHADEILVLQKGEIVERGTHDQLVALNGYYKRLVEMQEVR